MAPRRTSMRRRQFRRAMQQVNAAARLIRKRQFRQAGTAFAGAVGAVRRGVFGSRPRVQRSSGYMMRNGQLVRTQRSVIGGGGPRRPVDRRAAARKAAQTRRARGMMGRPQGMI